MEKLPLYAFALIIIAANDYLGFSLYHFYNCKNDNEKIR